MTPEQLLAIGGIVLGSIFLIGLFGVMAWQIYLDSKEAKERQKITADLLKGTRSRTPYWMWESRPLEEKK